jgi:hypothetical protein
MTTGAIDVLRSCNNARHHRVGVLLTKDGGCYSQAEKLTPGMGLTTTAAVIRSRQVRMSSAQCDTRRMPVDEIGALH